MIEIQVNNTWGRVLVEDPAVLYQIGKACSYKVKGAEYSGRYKAGHWDGTVKLFRTQSKLFPAGLLGRVLQVLDRHGLRYMITDIAPPVPPPQFEWRWNTRYVPRDYQVEFVETAVTARRGILKLATGGGKTLIAADLIRRLGLPTLFVVDGTDLAEQTVDRFREYMPGCQVGLFGAGSHTTSAPVTVAVVQALAHNLGLITEKVQEGGEEKQVAKDVNPQVLEWIRRFPVVIYDECHGTAAKRGTGTLALMKDAAFRIGLSATPLERGDNANLLTIAATGDVLKSITSSELIARGWLARPYIYLVPFHHHIPSKTSYSEVMEQGLTHNVRRNLLIADLVLKSYLSRPDPAILILIQSIQHGQILQNVLHDSRVPWKVSFIHGSTDKDLRKRTLDSFRSGGIKILIGSQILNKGIDLPNLTALINAGGLKDAINTQQKLGRALHVNAPEVAVYDIMDTGHRYLADHSKERLGIYQREPEFRMFRMDSI